MHPVSSRFSRHFRLTSLGLACLVAASFSRATSVVPPTFDELVNQSDYIVQAVVKSVVAESRLSPSGDDMIYSRVELEVKQVIAGKPPATVVLQVLGGKLGDRELTIEGAPKFKVGEESVFFVQGNGTQIFPLVRMMHGLYGVHKDPATQREYLTRSNGEPLRDVSEVSGPMEHAVPAPAAASTAGALSPSVFAQKIRATARQPQLLEH
ncbi:MAG: hypothetical protein JWM32_326 [Verrucomicrobia bacterium]|nr:hypothetical protein [Verrucomicrobiota bacterium]